MQEQSAEVQLETVEDKVWSMQKIQYWTVHNNTVISIITT